MSQLTLNDFENFIETKEEKKLKGLKQKLE